MENREVLLKRKNSTLMHTRLVCYFYLDCFDMEINEKTTGLV